MSGIWDLDFKPELSCEAVEGCKWERPAEWVLRRPCCTMIWCLCERHKTMMEAVMTGARNFTCDACHKSARVKDCVWERIKR